MKYSYTWLKELSRTKKSPKELAELLTMRAFELEDIKTEGKETQMEFSFFPIAAMTRFRTSEWRGKSVPGGGSLNFNATYNLRLVSTEIASQIYVEIKNKY